MFKQTRASNPPKCNGMSAKLCVEMYVNRNLNAMPLIWETFGKLAKWFGALFQFVKIGLDIFMGGDKKDWNTGILLLFKKLYENKKDKNSFFPPLLSTAQSPDTNKLWNLIQRSQVFFMIWLPTHMKILLFANENYSLIDSVPNL